jgi:hypothetical protein
MGHYFRPCSISRTISATEASPPPATAPINTGFSGIAANLFPTFPITSNPEKGADFLLVSLIRWPVPFWDVSNPFKEENDDSCGALFLARLLLSFI